MFGVLSSNHSADIYVYASIFLRCVDLYDLQCSSAYCTTCNGECVKQFHALMHIVVGSHVAYLLFICVKHDAVIGSTEELGSVDPYIRHVEKTYR